MTAAPPCLAGCGRPRALRGLCVICYHHARLLVIRGQTTWGELEREGKALPPAPRPPRKRKEGP